VTTGSVRRIAIGAWACEGRGGSICRALGTGELVETPVITLKPISGSARAVLPAGEQGFDDVGLEDVHGAAATLVTGESEGRTALRVNASRRTISSRGTMRLMPQAVVKVPSVSCGGLGLKSVSAA
jgi:hypothetical protein